MLAEDLDGRYQLLVDVLKVTPRFRRGPRRSCAREGRSRHASGNVGLSVRTYPKPGRAGAHAYGSSLLYYSTVAHCEDTRRTKNVHHVISRTIIM